MNEIDPKEIGALQADVRTLMKEIHLLREEIKEVNEVINRGRGGLYVLLLLSGAVGGAISLFAKKMLG